MWHNSFLHIFAAHLKLETSDSSTKKAIMAAKGKTNTA